MRAERARAKRARAKRSRAKRRRGPEPELNGIPYSDLGPPRLVNGWKEFDAEIARQERLVEAGLMRRGLRRGYRSNGTYGPHTYAWQRYEVDDKGTLRWGWGGWNAGIPGGTWPDPGDYEKAWEAGETEYWLERGLGGFS